MMEDLTHLTHAKSRTIGLEPNKTEGLYLKQNQREESVDDVSSISAQPNSKFQKDRIIGKLFPKDRSISTLAD